jgi:hypothetical protein
LGIFRKKGTLSLIFYDILQQKLTIRENIGDNFRQLNRFNALTSFVMFSFTYEINRFGRANRPEKGVNAPMQTREAF